jgi:ATP-binding cassette subfamily B protein
MKDSTIQYIFSCVRSFKYWIIAQCFIGIFWAIDMSVRPFILKVMIDRLNSASPETAVRMLTTPAALYIGMSLLMVFFFRIYDFIWLNINPGLKRYIGNSLMNRMMQHSPAIFQDQFTGKLGNKIKDVMSGIPDILRLFIHSFFSHLLALLIAIFTFWTVNYKFACGLTLWVVIFVAGSLIMSKKARVLSITSAEMRSAVMGYIVDILGNIVNVKLFSGHRVESAQLEKHLNAYVVADRKRDWFFLYMFAFQGLSFVLYQAVCMAWLIMGFKNGYVSAGDFTLIVSINIAIVKELWSLSEDIGKFARYFGNIDQGLSIVLSPLTIIDKEGASELVVSKGEIVFDKVQFHYKDADVLFEDKSITIHPGQKVGLVGYSGSGKSTFVNLILRLFDIDSGSIKIDGQDIRDVTQDSLRKAVAIIPQDPSLFHRSLMENIRYSCMEATDQEVMQAAKNAHAHEFITKMPQGYDTPVGERGIKISGGQRQRIAIARAILKNAPILILDEATSQLDSVTENLIQDSLNRLMEGKTSIVIAHRLSTLLGMDRILVFDQGTIVEDGTHQELLERGGIYKTLWEAQVGGFLPE